MRSRFLSIVGALAVGSAAFANVAAAQQEGHNIPRTADGRPDLSGTYDIATLTPLQRPETFGDKLTLTGEEAEAIAKKEADMVAKAAEASDPNPGRTGGRGRGVRWRARCAGAGLRGRRSRRLQLVLDRPRKRRNQDQRQMAHVHHYGPAERAASRADPSSQEAGRRARQTAPAEHR